MRDERRREERQGQEGGGSGKENASSGTQTDETMGCRGVWPILERGERERREGGGKGKAEERESTRQISINTNQSSDTQAHVQIRQRVIKKENVPQIHAVICAA